jgi:hypothetical protein
MVEELALDFENRRYLTKNECLTAPTLECCPKMSDTTTLSGTPTSHTAKLAVAPPSAFPQASLERRHEAR